MKKVKLLTACGFAMSVLLAFASSAAQRSNGTNPQNKKEVTFSKDVAPIFYKNCAACHREGNIAPMSLLTYKEARPWARSIRESVATGRMPPWHADPRYGEFANDARLSQKEIDTIIAWVNQGAKEGDPKDLPPAPTFSDEWSIGKPDVIIPIPQEFTLTAEGEDHYEYFTVPTNFTEDRWVQAVELRPSNRKIVHHAHVYIQNPPNPKYKAADDPWQKYFDRHDKLGRIRADLPVINDGCKDGPNGGYFPGVEPGSGGGPLGSYVPGKEPEVWP